MIEKGCDRLGGGERWDEQEVSVGCRPWGGGVGLEVEDGGCGEIKDRGAGKEFRSYILVSHSVELFQFLGPVPGLLLGNICSSTQCKRWKTQSPPRLTTALH